MFEEVGEFEEWEPIPAAVLASIGGWDIPDPPGEAPSIPAGLDDPGPRRRAAPDRPGHAGVVGRDAGGAALRSGPQPDVAPAQRIRLLCGRGPGGGDRCDRRAGAGGPAGPAR